MNFLRIVKKIKINLHDLQVHSWNNFSLKRNPLFTALKTNRIITKDQFGFNSVDNQPNINKLRN